MNHVENIQIGVEDPLRQFGSILLVSAQSDVVARCRSILETVGIRNLLECYDRQTVGGLLAEQEICAVIIDLTDSFFEGESLLQRLAYSHPNIPFLVLTSDRNTETGVRCMRAGAFEFLLKPVDPKRLIDSVLAAIEFRLSRPRDLPPSTTYSGKQAHCFKEIVTCDPRMFETFRYIEAVAPSSRPVLVTGETGVGKELVARAIHQASGCGGPYLGVNVAGLDEHAFSDTLFGHLKGAFTGADGARAGLVEKASNGTLLLDEIGDLDESCQVKLLRLLQEKEYFPLGSDSARSATTRFVLTTHRNLHELQLQGKFRTDLFHRLQTHHVFIPPLRERSEDLPLLLDHFLQSASEMLQKKKPTPPPELLNLLKAYPFPGNVRELESMVYDAVSRHTAKMLSMRSFVEYIESRRSQQPDLKKFRSFENDPFSHYERLPTLRESNALLLKEALRRANENRNVAASLLGITRSGITKALKRHGIS